MAKLLVTGGAGFIGSHLTEKLISDGNEVVVIDDLSTGKIENIENQSHLTLIQSKVERLSIEPVRDIDGIFHLAAQASVPKSIDEFYYSSKNNLLSTLKVFDWATKLDIPIVYSSSSAIYGNLPIGNDKVEKYNILSPYAQDKLTMEHYAKMAFDVYKTKSIGLRFFNVFGPRQDSTSPYSGVISIFIYRLLKELPITVNGGYQTRDFIYVEDVVNCIIKSMGLMKNNSICATFNVGTGISISIENLLALLVTITNKKPSIIKEKLPVGDPEISKGCYKKMEETLDLKLESFMKLEEGLRRTVNYYLS